jgi:1-acyl-sn-glycerol-3-phosphate acyltransferase
MADDLVPMKEQVYKDPRPKEYFDRFHERSRTKAPNAMYEIVRSTTTLYSLIFFRATCISSEKVPQSGPLIIAPNHFSHMDHFLVGAFIRRKVRFMAKSQMFKAPLQFIYTHGGVFPVRRGQRDQEAFETAHTILEREGCLAMYCEGGRSRTGKLAERRSPASGASRSRPARRSCRRDLRLREVRNWKRLQFPKITVQYGDPIRFEPVADPTREQQQIAADEIFDEIKRLYAGLESLGRRGVLARVREERRALRRSKRSNTRPPSRRYFVTSTATAPATRLPAPSRPAIVSL